MTRALAGLLVVAVLAAACAAPATSTRARGEAPRARCLVEPEREGATRPLFFLFCVEAP